MKKKVLTGVSGMAGAGSAWGDYRWRKLRGDVGDGRLRRDQCAERIGAHRPSHRARRGGGRNHGLPVQHRLGRGDRGVRGHLRHQRRRNQRQLGDGVAEGGDREQRFPRRRRAGAIVTLSLPFITEASPGHLTPCSGWQHPRVSCSPASEDSPISGRFERGRLKRLPWHS